jgi:hypothetical protein
MDGDLLTLLGAVAPDEVLIEQLENALEKYKETKKLDDLGLQCMLILSKIAAEAHGGPMELMKELDKSKAANKLLDLGKS